MEECPVYPRDCRMVAADPAIVLTVVPSRVIGDVKVETEAVAVEHDSTIKIAHLQYHGHQTPGFRHTRIVHRRSTTMQWLTAARVRRRTTGRPPTQASRAISA